MPSWLVCFDEVNSWSRPLGTELRAVNSQLGTKGLSSSACKRPILPYPHDLGNKVKLSDKIPALASS